MNKIEYFNAQVVGFISPMFPSNLFLGFILSLNVL